MSLLETIAQMDEIVKAYRNHLIQGGKPGFDRFLQSNKYFKNRFNDLLSPAKEKIRSECMDAEKERVKSQK